MGVADAGGYQADLKSKLLVPQQWYANCITFYKSVTLPVGQLPRTPTQSRPGREGNPVRYRQTQLLSNHYEVNGARKRVTVDLTDLLTIMTVSLD